MIIITKESYYMNMYLLVRFRLNRRGNMIYIHCQPQCYNGENPGLTQSKKKILREFLYVWKSSIKLIAEN